jgi:alpha-1,4-digalacturonate transport system permease protein
MGFYTLILLAGLQAIPAVLYEAGQIDGTGRWQAFRHITLPLLMPTMFVVLVLALIRAVQVFDQVFVLTGGGPGTATKYMVQYIYETGFRNNPPRRGLAASASVLMGIVLMMFTLVQLWLGRKSEAA